MSLARFFDRTYAAAGRALSASRASLEEALNGRPIAVVCGPECEEPGNAQWISTLSVNLLARMYPELVIEGLPNHVSELKTLARAINPSISLSKSLESATATLCVGSPAHEPRSAIFAGASGWVAHVQGQAGAPLGLPNPFSAAAAAALAVSRVFRTVFANHLPAREIERDTHLSLLDFGATNGADLSLGELHLGEMAMFGLGAVANGTLWALARHPSLSGRVFLVDHELVELSNLQRYVLTTDADVGRAKTDVAHDVLARPTLDLELRAMTLEAFADERGDHFDIPSVLVSIDQINGRRATQALLPRLVVNGWTGEGALGASWHVFSQDAACLACLYHPTRALPSQTELVADALGLTHERAAMLWVTRAPLSDSDLAAATAHLGLKDLAAWRGRPINELYRDVVCGTVSLDMRGVGRVEAVPLAHQSAMAGTLAAAELVKRLDPTLTALSQQEPLIAWGDVLRPPPTHWVQPRSRVQGCICTDSDYQAVYASKWASSTPAASGTSA